MEAINEVVSDLASFAELRAAAKNFHSVLVVPSPEWYPAVEEEMGEGRTVGLEFRQKLASRAFDATSRYDALITSYLRP